jgi:hypothetical protein
MLLVSHYRYSFLKILDGSNTGKVIFEAKICKLGPVYQTKKLLALSLHRIHFKMFDARPSPFDKKSYYFGN